MLSLKQVAEIVDGEVVGDENFVVEVLSSLQSSTSCSLSFCSYPFKHSLSLLQHTRAGAVLLSSENINLFSGHKVIVDKPRLAYAKVSHCFKKRADSASEDLSNKQISSYAEVANDVVLGHHSIIESGARIASKVVIGNYVHIGRDVEIKEGSIIEHLVMIDAHSKIGKNCHICSGAIIGSSGFGYEYDERENRWYKIEHLGSVVIGENVDVGANTTIDRGTLDDTVIANGVKMDNQIQIGHNVIVGENTIIAGCVGIAGSTIIGARCRIGGRAAISDHVHITDDVTILVSGQVVQDIDKPGIYSSVLPVQPGTLWNRNLAKLRKLYSQQ